MPRIVKRKSLKELADRYVTAKIVEEDAVNTRKLLEEELVQALAEAGLKTTTVVDGDKQYKMTFVANDRVSLDEEGLKKALPAKLWKRVTKEVLDRKKLEDAVNSGEVTPEIVGAYTSVSRTKPYIRFTEGVRKSEEAEDD